MGRADPLEKNTVLPLPSFLFFLVSTFSDGPVFHNRSSFETSLLKNDPNVRPWAQPITPVLTLGLSFPQPVGVLWAKNRPD